MIEALSKDEKNLLLYIETCVVDYAGTVEAVRMNEVDFEAAKTLEEKGLCSVRRLKIASIEKRKGSRKPTHHAILSDEGWVCAQRLRKEKAEMRSKRQKITDDEVTQPHSFR